MEDVCFNCCVPFDDVDPNENLEDGILSQQFTSSTDAKKGTKVNEIIITNSPKSENSITTTTTVSVSRALSSIFKLKYLNAFSDEEEEKEDEELSLCLDCSEVLTQIYSLFNCFIQLQKLDSSLAHRIERLDEIIDCHQQRSINCDLIAVPKRYSGTRNRKKSKLSSSGRSDSKIENRSTFIFNREPRIILTRLPSTSLPPPAQQQQQQQILSLKEEIADLDIDFDDSLWEPIAPCSFDDDSRDSFNDVPLSTKREEPYRPAKELSDEDEEWTQSSTRRGRGRPANKNLKRKRQPKQRKIVERNRKKIKQPKQKNLAVSSSSSSITELNSSAQVEDATDQNFEDSGVDNSKANDNTDNFVVVKRTKKPSKNKERPRKSKPGKKSKLKNLPKKKTDDQEGTFKSRNETSYKIRRTKVPNPCWYCRLHFDTPELCVEHTKNVHTSKVTQNSQICSRCSKICTTDKLFSLHMSRCELIPMGVVLPLPFKCPDCPNAYATAFQVRNHCLTHSNKRPFACDQCSYAAKSAIVLSNHKRNIHMADKDDKKTCDECGTVLKNERYLYWHKVHQHTPEGRERYKKSMNRMLAKGREQRRQRAAENSTVCATCNVDFFTAVSLTFHRKAAHPAEFRSGSVCHLCGRNFSRADTLSTHLRRVHCDGRPYLCQKCGKDFKTAQSLKQHDQHTHDEEGRLRYNAETRERNRRKKLLNSHIPSNIKPQQSGPGQGPAEVMMDQECLSNECF